MIDFVAQGSAGFGGEHGSGTKGLGHFNSFESDEERWVSCDYPNWLVQGW
jgi:hypothetical protein